jgi:hypothetical protein
LLAVLLALPHGAHAQQAGEVEFVRGVAFAQTGTQLPRAMGKGLALKEGDRLTTAEGAQEKAKEKEKEKEKEKTEVVIGGNACTPG